MQSKQDYDSEPPEYCWHIHHQTLVEDVWKTGDYEGIDGRIEYIKEAKPKYEVPLRLHLIRPVKGVLPQLFLDYVTGVNYEPTPEEIQDMRQDLIELHKKECDPQCPWRFSSPVPYSFSSAISGNIFWNANWDRDSDRYALKDGTVPPMED